MFELYLHLTFTDSVSDQYPHFDMFIYQNVDINHAKCDFGYGWFYDSIIENFHILLHV